MFELKPECNRRLSEYLSCVPKRFPSPQASCVAARLARIVQAFTDGGRSLPLREVQQWAHPLDAAMTDAGFARSQTAQCYVLVQGLKQLATLLPRGESGTIAEFIGGYLRVAVWREEIPWIIEVRILDQMAELHWGVLVGIEAVNHSLGTAYAARLLVLLYRVAAAAGDRGTKAEAAATYSDYVRTLQRITGCNNSAEWCDLLTKIGKELLKAAPSNPEFPELAISCFSAVLLGSDREHAPEVWALANGVLAQLISQRLRGESSHNIEVAIGHCKAALSVFTLRSHPQKAAGLLGTLGNLYQKRMQGEATQNAEQAIVCYRSALGVFAERDDRFGWAQTLVNMSRAYHARCTGVNGGDLEEAIDCCEKALTVLTREQSTELWALAHCNLGAAYAGRDRGNRDENCDCAAEHFRLALSVWTVEEHPLDWAVVQYNLAGAQLLANAGRSGEKLEEAIASLQAALTVLDPQQTRAHWSYAAVNLGICYVNRMVGDRQANLREAKRLYLAVLEVTSRDTAPQLWALTNNALANACGLLSGPESTENRKLAVDSLQAVLSVWSRELAPMQWAVAQVNLSNAYARLPRDLFPEAHAQAKACLEDALGECRNQGHGAGFAAARLHHNLAMLHRHDGKASTQAELLLAIDSLERAYRTSIENDQLSLQSTTTWEMARTWSWLGKNKKAEKWFSTCIDGLAETYASTVDPAVRDEFVRNHAAVIFHSAIGFYLGTRRWEKALACLERLRAMSVLGEIDLGQLVPDDVPGASKYWEVVTEISALRSLVANDSPEVGVSAVVVAPDARGLPAPARSFSGPSGEHLARLKDRLSDRERIYNQLRRVAPEYARRINAEPLTSGELAAMLRHSESVAVECLVSQNGVSFLCIVPDKGAITHHLIELGGGYLPPSPLNEFREALPSGSATISAQEKLVRLLDWSSGIVTPLASFLATTGYKRIYLSPHGYLTAIPLHAARVDNDVVFADRFDVCYTPSLTLSHRLWRSKMAAKETTPRDLVMALYFSAEQSPLPYGRSAFQALKALLPPERLWPLGGKEATLSALGAALQRGHGRTVCIDFSCHGEVGCLHLAGGPVGPADILRLPLAGIPVAVLNACHTGRSETWAKGYEHYHGIDGLFMQSGVLSTVSSLYQLDDRLASLITLAFYTELLRGDTDPWRAYQSTLKSIRSGTAAVASKPRARISAAEGEQKLREREEALQASLRHPYYWASVKYSGTF